MMERIKVTIAYLDWKEMGFVIIDVYSRFTSFNIEKLKSSVEVDERLNYSKIPQECLGGNVYLL